MRNYVPVVVVCLLCFGCQMGREVRHADQATQRAAYLQAEAAGFQKRAQVAEEVIRLLQEQQESERKLLDRYKARGDEADQRLAELQSKKATSAAEKRASDLMIQRVRNERDGMRVKVQDQQKLIGVIQGQIAQQRSYRRQMLEEAEKALEEARRMEQRAAELAGR